MSCAAYCIVVFVIFLSEQSNFAVLDVSSLPLQKCPTSVEVFFTLIFAVILVGTNFIREPSTWQYLSSFKFNFPSLIVPR